MHMEEQMNAFLLRNSIRALTVICTVAWMPIGSAAVGGPDSSAPLSASRMQASADLAASRSSLRFEENLGQTDERVRFIARSPGLMLFLTDTDAVFALAEPRSEDAAREMRLDPKRAPEPSNGRVIRMRMNGVHPRPALSAEAELPGVSNYFLGDDPAGWRAGVRSFGSVRYSSVYQGVDLFYYGNDGALEYDFVVAPGIDARQIELVFDGADAIELTEDGSLVIRAGPCELRQAPPACYQSLGDGRETVSGRFEISDGNTVRFDLGAYDTDRPLVIDPTLSYSTYLGGGLDDKTSDVKVDGWGQAYVVGYTTSPNFPRVNGPWTYSGEYDAFVTVLGRAGMALLYSTYLGGTDDDYASAVALDAEGAVHLVGTTLSSNFPVVNPIETNAGNPDLDAFVAKISPTGTSLVYSTYLGGDDEDRGGGIAVDTAGSAYVCGSTRSTDFPTVSPYQTDQGHGPDAFISKLSASGTSLVYSTYLGSTGEDGAADIAVTGGGEAVVAGYTNSADFPRMNPFQNVLRGELDCFVTKLSSTGTALRFSTYLGGSDYDDTFALDLDSDGAAVIVGYTYSNDFPTHNAIYDDHVAGDPDAFVLGLTPGGNALRFSTYLPGNDYDGAYDVTIGPLDRVYVVGSTYSTNFPLLGELQHDTDGTQADAFVTCLNPAGTTLYYSTYLGGMAYDAAVAVAVDNSGSAYVAGITQSSNFPTVNPYQAINRGGEHECFVSKIAAASADLRVTLECTPEPVYTGQQLTYTLRVANLGPYLAGDVIASLNVPEGTRFVSYHANVGHYVPPHNTGIGYFYIGSVGYPFSTGPNLTLVVEVVAAGGATIVNSAAVISTAPDPVSANNTAMVTSHVITGIVPPDITTATGLVVAGKPYRIRLDGTNFQPGLRVYVGTDSAPWPSVKYKSATRLILKGSALKSRFPRGQMVQIRVVNPDTGSDTIQFTR